MKVKEVIESLQKVEDKETVVYKVDEHGHFVPICEEDLDIVEFGEACDVEGNTILDEYPEYTGMQVFCVNANSINNL